MVEAVDGSLVVVVVVVGQQLCFVVEAELEWKNNTNYPEYAFESYIEVEDNKSINISLIQK